MLGFGTATGKATVGARDPKSKVALQSPNPVGPLPTNQLTAMVKGVTNSTLLWLTVRIGYQRNTWCGGTSAVRNQEELN